MARWYLPLYWKQKAVPQTCLTWPTIKRKQERGSYVNTLHESKPWTIFKTCHLFQDLWRVNVFENLMTDVEKVAFAREYNTLTEPTRR